MSSALLLACLAELLFYIFEPEKSADFSGLLFSQKEPVRSTAFRRRFFLHNLLVIHSDFFVDSAEEYEHFIVPS